MKARRMVLASPVADSARGNGELNAGMPGTIRVQQGRMELSDVDRSILGDLFKSKYSRLSGEVAKHIGIHPTTVEAGFERLFEQGLVRQPKNCKGGYRITEAGRTVIQNGGAGDGNGRERHLMAAN